MVVSSTLDSTSSRLEARRVDSSGRKGEDYKTLSTLLTGGEDRVREKESEGEVHAYK